MKKVLLYIYFFHLKLAINQLHKLQYWFEWEMKNYFEIKYRQEGKISKRKNNNKKIVDLQLEIFAFWMRKFKFKWNERKIVLDPSEYFAVAFLCLILQKRNKLNEVLTSQQGFFCFYLFILCKFSLFLFLWNDT